MRTQSIQPADWRGVLPVPPLARKNDGRRSLDFDESGRIVRHIASGGITRLLYGGNAFLYHVTLAEYESMIEWLSGLDDSLLAIPSAGPSYGRAMDQAALLNRYGFPCAMMLPCGDPRDAAGLERGYRDIADSAGMPLIVYIKDEGNLGANRDVGLDAVARLVDDGVCCAIKYAVVRQDPRQDAYLDALLRRVDRGKVISGIGERPAIVHLRDFGLPGFTTGSGCLAPRLSNDLFARCVAGDYAAAEALRECFIAVEDIRDAWGPARVLHRAVELAGIAQTGPIAPYTTGIDAGQSDHLAAPARALVEANAKAMQPAAALVS